jgi:hypothetical protein
MMKLLDRPGQKRSLTGTALGLGTYAAIEFGGQALGADTNDIRYIVGTLPSFLPAGYLVATGFAQWMKYEYDTDQKFRNNVKRMTESWRDLKESISYAGEGLTDLVKMIYYGYFTHNMGKIIRIKWNKLDRQRKLEMLEERRQMRKNRGRKE